VRMRLVRNDAKPGKTLPSLLEFYGDSDKLEAWLQQARAKIEVDYYGCTNFAVFWALNASLRGKAMRRMEAWVREYGTPELANPTTFLERMEFLFKDPQSKQRAQRKLEALRQGARPFLEVFTEWQSLLMESGGNNWPDDAKKVSLDRILSDDLVRAMIAVPTQPDFESYCSLLKESDDRLRAYKTRTLTKRGEGSAPASRWRRGNDTAASAPAVEHESRVIRKISVERMDWQPEQTRVAAARPQRAVWATQEERDRRLKMGRCLRCGASGHIIRGCPYLPPRRPTTANAVRPEADKEWEPEVEDAEEEPTTESEN